MGTTLQGLTFEAFAPQASAQFWAAALHTRVAPGATDERAELVATADAPLWVFSRCRRGRTMAGPLRLVLTTADPDAESRRLVRLGARRLGAVHAGARCAVTLANPEGNAFTLVAA